MLESIYKGIITALITPFKDDLLDYESLEKLIEHQIKAKINGIVVGGSTGEGTSLCKEDYYSLVHFCIKTTKGRVPIIAGITAVSTSVAIEKVSQLCNIGIQGIMCTAPHYIKPTQKGLIEHFIKVHDISTVPIMLYAHPGRTGVDFNDETITKLSELKKIQALKDAGSDIDRPLRLSSKLKKFSFLTGNDSNMLAYNAHGGQGCVSVVSNIIPEYSLNIQKEWQMGNTYNALELQQKIIPLYEALLAEGNPIGIKYATSLLGLCRNEVKSPLIIATDSNMHKIKDALRSLGIN